MVEFATGLHDSGDEEFDLETEAELEQELRASLQARLAPDGFADRVLARVNAVPLREPASRPVRNIRNPIVRGVLAAMLLLSVGVGGYMEHQRERQIAGEHARQQVLLALRITGSTLQDVRNKVGSDDGDHATAN